MVRRRSIGRDGRVGCCDDATVSRFTQGGAVAIQLEARLRHDLRLERGRGERDAAALEHALSDLMES